MDIFAQKKSFREETTRGDFKVYISEPFSPEKIGMLKAAVSQGYSDAKRTFTNISEFWNETKTRDSFFSFVANKIQSIFFDPQQDFDRWHQTACESLCDWFDNYKVSYGQAQKIINMAFKYLYCLEKSEEYSAVFDHCHMPLDSFTLEWYKRYVYKENQGMVKITDQVKWSNLTKPQYLKIVEEIEKYLKSKPKFYWQSQEIVLSEKPIDSELFIWPEMQMHMSAESFLFTFATFDAASKRDCKKKSVQEKLAHIQQLIKNYLPE